MEEKQFEQMQKNSVDAKNQLKESSYVLFENLEGKGKRIMFLGNSITLHGVKHEIGWHNAWGMAASAKEKDYVHLLMEKVRGVESDSVFCICQGSKWETTYKDGTSVYPIYEHARAFEADIIVVRLIENCSGKEFEPEVFKASLEAYLDYLNPSGNAKIVLTTGFWKHPGDEQIRKMAEEKNLPFISLGDLGEQDEMKAIGLFEHVGVANHPGDLGMKTIAERIWAELEKLL